MCHAHATCVAKDMLGKVRSLLSRSWPFHGAATMMDAHDDWNLLAIGALNLAHTAWWFGMVATNGPALSLLFYADCCYMLADCCWLLFVPTCVPARVRGTLLVHHFTTVVCMPIAAGNPVFMKHLLRTWSVELHSWNHIASRRFSNMTLLARINKPLFVILRLIGFPLTWFAYARDRAALLPAVRDALLPAALHWPLTLTHVGMYGLMLKWGAGLLLPSKKED
jgi:hypothetical protein